MSATDQGTDAAEAVEVPVGEQQASAGSSLKARIAQRREDLHREKQIVLEIPGFAGLVSARYKALPYEAVRDIGRRNEKEFGDTTECEVVSAADTLAHACIELLEQRDDGSYGSSGQRWTPAAARDVFSAELPEGAQARTAIRSVLSSGILMLHFKDYMEWLDDAWMGVDKSVEGESGPSREG